MLKNDYKILLTINILLAISLCSADSQTISSTFYSLHEILIWTSMFIFVIDLILIINVFMTIIYNIRNRNEFYLKNYIILIVLTILLIIFNINFIFNKINVVLIWEYFINHIKIEL